MADNKNKYSSTVLLPKTDFPMRAGLPKKEPQLLAFWEGLEIYKKMLAKSSGKEKFVLGDGPPYANGAIHLGHALNKILKDIVVKSHIMMGYDSHYVPGWDCHGLPIEQAMLKEMKIDKKDITDIGAFRAKARAFAQKFVDLQMDGFKRLGVTADWENPYLTMAKEYEGLTVAAFLEALEKGLVYKGKKAIYWCPCCETALADAEIEYKDSTSPSIYLRFEVKEFPAGLFGDTGDKKVYLTVWTTTPWTIPANMAAAVNFEEDYVVLHDDKSCIVVADKLADEFLKATGLNMTKGAKVKGEKLVGVKYEHPLNKNLNPVIHTDFVTMDSGVGIVHIAPGHGEEDFYAGKKWGIDAFCPVDEKGVFTKEAGEFAGLPIFKANPVIIEKLNELGSLIKQVEITHSYPHCWRCKKPVIFRATEQWFLSIDQDNLRGRLVEQIEKTEWIPANGEERIKSMIQLRPDWCLSRQRYWGVPITVLTCKDCGKIQIDKKLFDHIINRAVKEGVDFWFMEEPSKLIPEGYKCSCGSNHFDKETDILDVWLDSGVSWKAVLKQRNIGYPADLYLEGSDQHRGWFQTSLIMSTALEGIAPFKKVVTHGFITDQNGKAMHKSSANGVSPQEVTDKYGADILRLWVGLTDYSDDVRMSKEILEGPIDTYRRIRNTIRYALGNLFDYEPTQHKVAAQDLAELDKYMLNRLDALIKQVTDDYKNFRFRNATRAVTNFCILDLSALMLDASKDRLYTLGANSQARRSAQTVLHEVLVTLVKLLAPTLCFTCEESWQEIKKLPCGKGMEESVLLSEFPKGASNTFGKEIDAKWDKIREVRSAVLKALEEARRGGLIGSSLEAKIILNAAKEEDKTFIKNLLPLWTEICIVSAAEVDAAATEEALSVKVEHAQGAKCPRCWQWKTDIGSNSKHSELCGRCAEVLEKEGVNACV